METALTSLVFIAARFVRLHEPADARRLAEREPQGRVAAVGDGGGHGRHAIGDGVERDVLLQSGVRGRIGLEREHASSRADPLREQHGVGADVGARLEHDVAGPDRGAKGGVLLRVPGDVPERRRRRARPRRREAPSANRRRRATATSRRAASTRAAAPRTGRPTAAPRRSAPTASWSESCRRRVRSSP